MQKENRKLVFSVRITDCKVDTFRTGGAGGQHRDKTYNGIRVRHLPSMAVGECSEHRSQLENKRIAFRRMGESFKFQMWAKTKALDLEPIEDIVDRMMEVENLKIEYAPFENRKKKK